MVVELVACLGELGMELVGVVPGNHDRALSTWAGCRFIRKGSGSVAGGSFTATGRPRGACSCRGTSTPACAGEEGYRSLAPVADERRLVLPAFSADAAGVNVLSDPHGPLCRCYAVAKGTILDLGEIRRIRRSVG